ASTDSNVWMPGNSAASGSSAAGRTSAAAPSRTCGCRLSAGSNWRAPAPTPISPRRIRATSLCGVSSTIPLTDATTRREMLKLTDLRLDYRTDEGIVEAVRGISLHVERGQFYTLLGP